jgi:linoleoyl-CoA desaturase
MVESRQFKFKEKVTTSGFSKTLSLRVDDYFQSRQISRHANAEMVAKAILGLTLWIATYYWLMTGRFSTLQVIGMYVLHGFVQLHMCFNIAHDGNHGAYSKSKRVNRVLGSVFDLVGGSSNVWRLQHNDSHHAFVNIQEADTTLISGNIFRFTPHDKRRPFHRYQHLYAPLIYCLCTLDWVLVKDFRWLLIGRSYGNKKIIHHPPGELAFLFATKAFYYTYMLVLPNRNIHASSASPWLSSSSRIISTSTPPIPWPTTRVRSPTITSSTSSTPHRTTPAATPSPAGFWAASISTSSTTCSRGSATSTIRP